MEMDGKNGSGILVFILREWERFESSDHVMHWDRCILKELLLTTSELLTNATLKPRQHTNFPNKSFMDITHMRGWGWIQVEFYVKGRFSEKIV